MSYVNRMLSNDRIRNLCRTALRDARGLEAALVAIYQEGFSDTPQMENAGRLFAQRFVQVREEYAAQLTAYQSDPEGWARMQLQLAEDPDAMACGLAILAGFAHGSQSEREACIKLLDRRMEAGPASPEKNQALVELFTRTPVAALFAGGRVPRITAQMAPQFAGILAMCTYVSVKREPAEGILPDLSFDTVCICSDAMTDVLCVCDGAAPEAAATVGCIMIAQYMHLPEWEVFKAGMESVCKLSYPTMRQILDQICGQVLACRDGREQPYPLAWIWPENAQVDYSRWVAVLWDQQTITMLRPDAEAEHLKETRKEQQKNEGRI